MKKPGPSKNTSLGERMKSYEEVTTGLSLVPRIPVYVRLDGRAFHSFCRGLAKPFDPDLVELMKQVTTRLHEETCASFSFCQSDEISLLFESPEKMPFGTRLFKVQSVFAGMASAAFCAYGVRSKSQAIQGKVARLMPHFDCRVCQMPVEECANAIVWRSQDAAKNSVTMLALAHFSAKAIHGKSGEEKIKMLKEKGVDYYALPEELRSGAFFRRELYQKKLTPDELARIPEANRPAGGLVTRSRIAQFEIGMPFSECANKVGVLFGGEDPAAKESDGGEAAR